MAFFFYWQQTGGEEAWQEALATDRQRVLTVERPQFVTVLDVSSAITEDMTPEEHAQLRYRGPLYFDWDATEISIAADAFKRFLAKLKDMGVDLSSVRLYATGGRGFHVEVPMQCFLSKPPAKGIANLPAIYKEMAYDLFTDTMDMRVYSARRGRMWRTCGVARSNGKYKVPLTVDEAFAITPETYALLCSSPREAPALTPAELSSKLAVTYAKAEQKVAAAVKRRKESSKDVQLLAKFGGTYPPTVARLMAGEGLEEKIGFHQIALQVGVVSNALGKTEDEMLLACAGLIENHQSDGTRYNSPSKRRTELVRMFHYTAGNVCYPYSKGAVKALLAKGEAGADLDGLTAEAGAVTSVKSDLPDDGLLGGVFLTETGVYKKTDTGALKISNLSYTNVAMLFDALTDEVRGFLATVLLDGKPRGEQALGLDMFMSKQKYQQFALLNGGIMQGTDTQVSAVAGCLREMAVQSGQTIYVLHREGLDIIPRPGAKEGVLDTVWVSPQGVETFDTSPMQYQFKPMFMRQGAFKSDLLDAPDLKGSEEEAAVVESLFKMNQPFVVGALLGWMVSTFHRALYRRLYSKFPLCHVYGQAGAGKSETLLSLLRLFYVHHKSELLQADSSTRYGIEGTIQSSSSLPVILDEYKPGAMRAGRHEMFLALFRAAYNEGAVRKGGGDGELGSGWRDLQEHTFTAPILFIGESLETQTAVLERSIVVPMAKTGLAGRDAHHRAVVRGGLVLSSIGREIMRSVFVLDHESFREMVDANIEEVRALAFKRENHRVMFNLAVPLSGLDYLKNVLSLHFSDRFSEPIARMREAFLDMRNHPSVVVMPEAAKVMNSLAFISKTEDSMDELGLKVGRDYCFPAPGLIDLRVRNCYITYSAWCRHKGQTALFPSEDAFIGGLSNYSATADRVCMDSPLKDSPQARVFRFNIAAMEEEGVEPFHGTP